MKTEAEKPESSNQRIELGYSRTVARRLLKNLGQWYEREHRKLPFRENVDWYKTLVSEIMLQQTRVAAMLPAFERFMERFPDPEALANAAEEDVLHHWAGLGYYNRARNLQKCVRQILEHHNGQFPSDRKQALNLAGVGPYTAAAVRSIAMDIADPVIDGNVVRVLNRIFYVHGESANANRNGEGENKQQSNQEDREKRNRNLRPLYVCGQDETSAAGEMATALMECSPLQPSVHNQAMMELGALVCTPGLPSCLVCPIRNSCSAFAAGGPEFASRIPKIKKAKKQDLELDVYWLAIEGALLLVRNPNRPLFKKDWFLPCRIRGEAGLIYSDFDESRFLDLIGDPRGHTNAEVSEDKRSSRKETTLLNPSTKPFKHSIMHYRIQGTVRYLDLTNNVTRKLMKGAWLPGTGPDSPALLASERPAPYGSESSGQAADMETEVMAIKPEDISKYCPSSIIKKVRPGS